jgi:hypothetical protein
MREFLEKALKIACLALAALLAVQSSRLALRKNPLAGLSIPALPSLPPSTNSVGGAATNSAPVSAGTAGILAGAPSGTNAASAPETRSTKLESSPKSGSTTNSVAAAPAAAPPLPSPSTNSAATARSSSPPNAAVGGSNAPSRQAAASRGARASAGPRSGLAGGRGGVEKPPELPPPIQARVDRIYQSQILGPVIRPSVMPAGLLGIAGNFAILRTTTGQTGLVKEGDELAGLKLLRIGMNRVLVEQEGKQKELTLFNGFGGESLLPPSKENPK